MRDAVAHRGPLAGLAAGLVALADIDRGYDAAALVVGGDMPHLVPAVLELLAAAVDADPAAGRRRRSRSTRRACSRSPSARRSPAPSWTRSSRDDRRALRALLDRLPVAVVPAATWRALDPDARTLDDIDTPARPRARGS